MLHHARQHPVSHNDPQGSRFDMYAIPTPEGDWGYILDDFGIAYRRTGHWPFLQEACRHYSRGPARRDDRPATVRVAPDVAYRSWRNEYVLLYPGRRDHDDSAAQSHWAHAVLDLWVRPQGLGGITVPVHIDIDLDSATAHVCTSCPTTLLLQATTKAARLIDFIQHHQRKARTRRGKPITAYDTYQRNTS